MLFDDMGYPRCNNLPIPQKISEPACTSILISGKDFALYLGLRAVRRHHLFRDADANKLLYLILWDSGKLIKMDILPEYTP